MDTAVIISGDSSDTHDMQLFCVYINLDLISSA